MTYDLVIGDRTYSSWSLRGWLLFEKFGIPVRCHSARLYSDELPELLKSYAPARLAPTVRTPEGEVIGETLAIAETLHERHPDAGLWPADPAARARARWLASEMHAGFGALRSACPMHLGTSYTGVAHADDVMADVARLEEIWSLARARFAGDGPWLCERYSAADVFFAPAATRIATYGIPVGTEAAAYVAAHLADPSFRRWRAMGRAENYEQAFYKRDHATRPWPGPAPVAARAVASGPSVNTACPYSGKPVTHFMEAGGKVWGFCNAFCRDKTAADPEAWPAFVAIYQS
ncbi:MAG: glutathione S-transferase N-terminal domain-containing protein [Paracoccaceae bacterium]